jgi:hypothetical protein
MPLIGRAAAHYLDNSIATDNISLHVGASYALLPDSSCRQLVCQVRHCMTVRVMRHRLRSGHIVRMPSTALVNSLAARSILHMQLLPEGRLLNRWLTVTES